MVDIQKQLPLEMWEEMKPIFAAAFPNEAVVAIHGKKWKQLANVNPNPMYGFSLTDDDKRKLISRPPTLFLHSHPHGSAQPSDMDTLQQLRTGWDWGIVAVRGGLQGEVYDVAYPECWGDGIAVPALIGRTYLWGIRDCWTLCHDWYALNGWKLPRIERARDPSIYPQTDWRHDQFAHAPQRLGFTQVARHERQRGDTALMQFKGNRYNHCALYLGEGKYLHQLEDALSCEWIPHDEERIIERLNLQYWRPPAKP